MSDSSRTGARRFFKTLLFIFLLYGPIAPNARAENGASTRHISAGLFDALSDLDLAHVLSAALPGEIVIESGIEKRALASAQFDILQYMRNNVDPRSAANILAQVPKYKRLEMFGAWVNEDVPQNCYNTRAEVMIRDAKPGTKVWFSQYNPCQVYRGTWNDPYTDQDYKMANAIQVDHVVPLKNAYRSGAHAWSRERRCHYANFLADPKHLLAVSAHENLSKGDSGPEDYLPPNPTYTCEYLANWMRIKALWNLSFTEDERQAIETNLKESSCAVTLSRVGLSDFAKARAGTNNMNVQCTEPTTSP